MFTALNWLGTVLCVSGCVVNIYKHKICFVLWGIANAIYIATSIYSKQWPQLTLFVVNEVITIWGFIKWHKGN